MKNGVTPCSGNDVDMIPFLSWPNYRLSYLRSFVVFLSADQCRDSTFNRSISSSSKPVFSCDSRSNLDQDTGCPDLRSIVIFSVLQVNVVLLPQSDHCLLFLAPYHLTIRVSYHLTLYSILKASSKNTRIHIFYYFWDSNDSITRELLEFLLS
jgi:hypothetical protein